MPVVRRAALLGAALLVAAATACSADGGGADVERADVVVASYDFPENQLLAELAAEALRRTGLEVSVATGLGSRDVVVPAMEQGHVDLVVDYAGSALDFLLPGTSASHGTPEEVHATLRRTLAAREVTALPYASAEDTNGFAMTASAADDYDVERLSELAPVAGALVIGGPPECPERRYCLKGLRDRYGLRFASFREMPSRADTAAALVTGEINVGMLETTDPRLFDGQLVLLEDDGELQPRENVVPLVREAALEAHGDRIEPALAAVTAALSTEELLALNRAVELAGVPVATAVGAWLDDHPPAG